MKCRRSHARVKRGLSLGSVLVLLLGLVVNPLLMSQPVSAAGGDFSLDFTAAAPLTYNHLFGGGAYDDREVGRDKDIVESLEGGDFACGDIVTYLTQIVVDGGAVGTQAIALDYVFTAYSTGQQGVALADIVSVAVNYGAVTDGDDGIDTGITDDGGSVATLVSETLTGPVFSKPSLLQGTVTVTDLEPGEHVIVRVDVRLACNGDTPTGNMQARLAAARVISGTPEAIRVGDQTIPFKNVGNIIKPPPTCGKDPLPPCDPTPPKP
jgi:hypothetical protein